VQKSHRVILEQGHVALLWQQETGGWPGPGARAGRLGLVAAAPLEAEPKAGG